MAVDVGLKVKEFMKVPLVVNWLDVPKALFSEEWRMKEYERVKVQCKDADFLTAISQSTADEVRQWLGEACPEIKVNYVGVDLDVYQAFQPTEEDYVCGVVRGLAKQKNYEEIVQAVQISKTRPKLQLIFGNHSDSQKAKVMSKSLFGLGMSSLEGFGIYVVEYGWFSKAFIARELSVFREIYEDAVEYVDSVDEMAEKIDLFVQNREVRDRKGMELHDLIVRKELTLQAHAKRLAEFLQKTI